MRKSLLVLILMIIPEIFYCFTISGSVFCSDTRECLEGVAVILRKSGVMLKIVISDSEGRFLIKNISNSNYILELKAPGFYKEQIEINLNRDWKHSIYLKRMSSYFLGEVEVIGEKDKGTVSKHTINRKVREDASLTILGDPLESFKKMPGVTANNYIDMQGNSPGIARLSVRGGNYFENSAVLDGVWIAYPFHTGYPDSIFIDDVLDDITLYKGVIPAEYGQTLSSLLKVDISDGINGLHGKIHVGVANTYLALNGASEDHKWNFSGGIRRFYLDLVFYGVNNLTSSETNKYNDYHPPAYLDSQGKIEYKDTVNTFTFLWLYSGEPSSSFSSNQSFLLDQKTDTQSGLIDLHWKIHISDRMYLQNSIAYFARLDNSRTLTSNDYVSDDGNYVNYDIKINKFDKKENHVQARTIFSCLISKDLSFKAGLDMIYYPGILVTNYSYEIMSNISIALTTNYYTLNGYSQSLNISAFFLENEIQLFRSFLNISWGLRLNYIDYLDKYSLDPRVTIFYNLNENFKLFTSAGLLSKFPTSPDCVQWLDTNKNNLDIPEVVHLVTGVETRFCSVFSLTLEDYYKKYIHAETPFYNHHFLIKTTGSEKRTYGYDLMLIKKPDIFPVYGWITLSGYWSWNFRSEAIGDSEYGKIGGMVGQILTGGDQIAYINTSLSLTYPTIEPPIKQWYISDSSAYKFNVTAIWDIQKNWTTTFDFNWIAGHVFTPISGIISNNVVYGEYHSAKLPDSHFLNVKIEWRHKFLDYPSGLYLQINNIYNNPQVVGCEYTIKGNIIKYIKLFGIYPVLGFWLKW